MAHQIFSLFDFCFEATPGSTQGYLALYSGVIPQDPWGPFGVAYIKLELAMCSATFLETLFFVFG